MMQGGGGASFLFFLSFFHFHIFILTSDTNKPYYLRLGPELAVLLVLLGMCSVMGGARSLSLQHHHRHGVMYLSPTCLPSRS